METDRQSDDTNHPPEVRETFTGKRLTEAQFDQSWAIAGIVHRGILRSGQFKEQLGDYAHALARTERFDAVRAETIIRDQFKARYGQTMNQMREDLMDREAALQPAERERGLDHAHAVGQLIQDGETMPFYRAYDIEAVELARSLDITESGAKSLMKDEFEAAERQDFYTWAKDIEEKHHLPKVEAERREREAERSSGPETTRTRRSRANEATRRRESAPARTRSRSRSRG